MLRVGMVDPYHIELIPCWICLKPKLATSMFQDGVCRECSSGIEPASCLQAIEM